MKKSLHSEGIDKKGERGIFRKAEFALSEVPQSVAEKFPKKKKVLWFGDVGGVVFVFWL